MTNWAGLTNVLFDELKIGATATYGRTLSLTDVEVLALVSGDIDPFYVQADKDASPPEATHIEAAGAKAIVAATLGTQLPGPGMHIVREELQYMGGIAVGDRLSATVTVREKLAEHGQAIFECCCRNQRGEVLVQGLVTVAVPRSRIQYGSVAPPQLSLRRGDVFGAIYRACAQIQPAVCAVVHPCDRESLAGAVEAARQGLIEPILVGPVEKIRSVAAAEGLELSPYRIVPAPYSEAAAARAVELARSGEVEALMKGSLHTDELMGAVVASGTGLRTERRISHVFVMDVPSYPRMLLITDAAINIYPKLLEKVDIVQNAIDLAQVLGIVEPKVAILSAVETVTPAIESTIEAAALCKMAERGQITGGVVDGPLAFDNAISARAAQIKQISSPVAGSADILVTPDLEAGNMLAKQLAYLAGAEGAGIALGARSPIALTSRADSLRSRLASAALLSLVAHARRGGGRGTQEARATSPPTAAS